MPGKKSNAIHTSDNLLDGILSTEDDIKDRDDYYEESEDYFVSGGKKIQKMKRHTKKDRDDNRD